MTAALSGTPFEIPLCPSPIGAYTGIAVIHTGDAPVIYISGAKE